MQFPLLHEQVKHYPSPPFPYKFQGLTMNLRVRMLY